MDSNFMPASTGLKRGIAKVFPHKLDGQVLKDANNRSNIAGDFFYNFVGRHGV